MELILSLRSDEAGLLRVGHADQMQADVWRHQPKLLEALPDVSGREHVHIAMGVKVPSEVADLLAVPHGVEAGSHGGELGEFHRATRRPSSWSPDRGPGE